MKAFSDRLFLEVPIIQAPMAGVSTPQLAAAVSQAGGLGSLGIGNLTANAARTMIHQLRELADVPFNVNIFCHQPAVRDPAKEAAWLRTLAPHFAEFNAVPPAELNEIYKSFLVDEEMLELLIRERPAVASTHFGLPHPRQTARLKEAGIILVATATNRDEALAIQAAGFDAIVAQGYEAGGHRGMFDPTASDERLGTEALVRQLLAVTKLPIIAAGGIRRGADIARYLELGADAVQMGTSFLLCPETQIDAGYRQALIGGGSAETIMTSVFSGRPARSVRNRFTDLGEAVAPGSIPAYPVAYDAGKALHAAAKSAGEFGFGAQWSGQSDEKLAPLSAAQLMARLRRELSEASPTRNDLEP